MKRFLLLATIVLASFAGSAMAQDPAAELKLSVQNFNDAKNHYVGFTAEQMTERYEQQVKLIEALYAPGAPLDPPGNRDGTDEPLVRATRLQAHLNGEWNDYRAALKLNEGRHSSEVVQLAAVDADEELAEATNDKGCYLGKDVIYVCPDEGQYAKAQRAAKVVKVLGAGKANLLAFKGELQKGETADTENPVFFVYAAAYCKDSTPGTFHSIADERDGNGDEFADENENARPDGTNNPQPALRKSPLRLKKAR